MIRVGVSIDCSEQVFPLLDALRYASHMHQLAEVNLFAATSCAKTLCVIFVGYNVELPVMASATGCPML